MGINDSEIKNQYLYRSYQDGDEEQIVEFLQSVFKIWRALVADGFNKGARRLISEESEKYGGLRPSRPSKRLKILERSWVRVSVSKEK